MKIGQFLLKLMPIKQKNKDMKTDRQAYISLLNPNDVRTRPSGDHDLTNNKK